MTDSVHTPHNYLSGAAIGGAFEIEKVPFFCGQEAPLFFLWPGAHDILHTRHTLPVIHYTQDNKSNNILSTLFAWLKKGFTSVTTVNEHL